MRTKKTGSLLRSKILFTFLIMMMYLLGKGIPLYMIDVSAYLQETLDADSLLKQTISGDINQCSIFALGISPYMISSILIQIITAFQKTENKSKVSPKKRNQMVMALTFLMALLMAVTRVNDLHFRVTGNWLFVAMIVAVLEMIAGVFFIQYIIARNQKYGIGGQSSIISLNILDGILLTLRGHDKQYLVLPLVISVIVIVIMIVLENTEKRIPVQRISIHNIYADKNYLAIKLNPIGIMPIMFATAFFMLPQLFVTWLYWWFPTNPYIMYANENMIITKPLGIVVYICCVYILTIGFSRVMINPKEMTDQFLKSGDSICDLHAGKETKKYLSKVINRMSFFSATVMSICVCGPMILQMQGRLDGAFVTLPSSVMMMTGVFCNIFREVDAVRDLEAYKPFI